MFQFLSKITSQRQHIIVVILVFVIAILFEAFQQLFYIKRFNLGNNVQFIEILKSQSYKWIVWVLLSFFLIKFSRAKAYQEENKKANYISYALVIFSLVFLSIIIISIIQLIINNDAFSFTLFFKEYVTFFTFQKAPIYTLGYIAIAIIMHFYFINEQLQVKVGELFELKQTNTELYEKLRENNDDKTSVLNIKIGNKRKIIPIKNITWIEADDYCVKVHTNEFSYTMRSTLKALENKLGSNFLRIHRKAIVNMEMAKELNLSNSPKLILLNNLEIPVSKSNLKVVKNFIAQF